VGPDACWEEPRRVLWFWKHSLIGHNSKSENKDMVINSDTLHSKHVKYSEYSYETFHNISIIHDLSMFAWLI
jgi:hypothetical protein